MYKDFFSFKTKPFSISPDPSFLFLSERHKEAITHLRHGLKGDGGFVLLTGEVGTGKTTICRSLLDEMGEDTDIASILNPALTEIELLSSICDAFNIECLNTDLKSLSNAVTQWVMENHQKKHHSVVLIDEAQHLSVSALEQLRLLTNIESAGKKILKIILIGQTELQEKLKQNEFRPLAQCITARYHLLSLTPQEVSLYVQHRLNVAGAMNAIFEKSALKEVYHQCKGIPRLTNILCDRSLLAAYTQDSHIVTHAIVKQASKEIHFTNEHVSPHFFKHHWRMIALLLLTAFTLFQAPKISQQLQQNDLFSNEKAATEKKDIKSDVTKEIIENVSQEWFDAYPQLDTSQTSYNDALSGLFRVWGYQTDSTANCEKGYSVLLTCYSHHSTLEELKKLNYPSIVHLQKDNIENLYAVLYKISDSQHNAQDNYQLLINDHLVNVSQAWFEQYWTGDSTMLWKAPFELKSSIQFGQNGDKITWLANQLNKIQGWPSEQKTHFDLHLLDQVTAFQRSQSILDDGIVGPRTLMTLTQLADSNLPRLLQGAK